MDGPATNRAFDAVRRWWRGFLAAATTARGRSGRWYAERARPAAGRALAALVRWWRAAVGRLRRCIDAVRAWFAERGRRRAERQRLPGVVIVAGRDDDLASVIGRVDTAEDIDLVLVVPRAARRLREPGVWPRLAAHVRRRGITLGVVAARRDVRHNAEASGLTAAGSLRALRRARPRRVRVGAREFDLPALGPGRVLRWLAPPAMVAAAFVTACYLVPSAEIVIVPPAEPFARTVTVRIDPVADQPDVARGVVPGITVRLTITSVLATETTGSAEVGEERAAVELLIANGGESVVSVAAGTRIVNESGISFYTVEEITVPAGESLTVPASAERPGAAGNLEADESWSIAGLPATLQVTNPRAASGGTDVTVRAVAAEDIDRLRALAPAVLARVGARELERTVESGTIFPETVTVAILGQEPLARVGEPADTLLVEFTAVVSGLVAPDEQTQAYGEALLVSELPDGFALLPGATAVELGTERRFDAGELSVELTVTGLVAELFDPAEWRDDLRGARPAAAAELLRQRLDLVQEPEITIHPDWLPWRRLPPELPGWWRWLRLPGEAGRIAIVFAGPPETEESGAEEALAP